MNTVYLTARQLQAARIIAADNDIRYYLNGVYIEAGKGCTRVVATNGHQMIIYDNPHAETQWEGSFIIPNATIDMLKPKVLKGGYERISIEVNETYNEHDTEHKFPKVECTLTYVDTVLKFKPIEGKFPDYARVVPAFIGEPSWWCVEPGIDGQLPTRIQNVHAGTVNPDTITCPEHILPDVLERMSARMKPANYAPQYISDWNKVGLIFNKKGKVPFNLFQNGYGSALITIDNQPNILGVLMPVRNEALQSMPVTDRFRTALALSEKETLTQDATQE